MEIAGVNTIVVKMREQVTGTRNGAYWPAPGGEIELPLREALDLIEQGRAELP